LKWLGLNWDEGPEVGGPHGPYLQSQRLEIYTQWAARFIEQGDAYYCYCAPEELEARREAQKESGQAPGYDGKCRSISETDLARYQSEGREPVIRMRMPDGSTTFTDVIRGDCTFDHNFVPDFVLVRADGSPLYTLAVAVDDVLMEVTHILRGEDLLSSTPRQIRVYQAMGVKEADYPLFAHLPFVMGADNAKLSKRNGETSIAWYREQGFLPEALCNYLALLGWSPGDDRENLTLAELTELFTIERVNSNPARFDMKKLENINGDKIRALTLNDFYTWSLPFLQRAKVVSTPISGEEERVVRLALPIIQERLIKLSEVPAMLAFLFTEKVDLDPESVAKYLNEDSKEIIAKALEVLTPLSTWDHQALDSALRAALIDQMGLKPRLAFSAIRVAVTGSHISPPLFESMEILGRERVLARLSAI
jgi:glutamyl-tRNA synthetase